MSDDNIVEFPTKERKHDVMRERTSKINGFTSPFTNTNYKINSIKVDGESWEKWTFPSLDSINENPISFENINDSGDLKNEAT